MTRDSRKRVERQIAENSRVTGKLDSYFVDTAQQPEREWNFGTSDITVSATVRVYTRSLGDTMVTGHPSESRGFGRGHMGDLREEWTLETTSEGEFTRNGRNTVVNALQGATSGMGSVASGSGSAPATVSDEALESEEGSAPTSYSKPSADESSGFGSFRFAQFGDEVNEAGLENHIGDLMARAATGGVDPSQHEEVKIDVTLGFDGDGASGVALTDDGIEAVSDSVLDPNLTARIATMAVGSGTSAPDPSDSALEDQVSEKASGNEWEYESVSVSMKWFETEPASQPVSLSEMGVFSTDGRLVLRATFSPYEKDSNVEVTFSASIKVI